MLNDISTIKTNINPNISAETTAAENIATSSIL
jgi:hypothetical protein